MRGNPAKVEEKAAELEQNPANGAKKGADRGKRAELTDNSADLRKNPADGAQKPENTSNIANQSQWLTHTIPL